MRQGIMLKEIYYRVSQKKIVRRLIKSLKNDDNMNRLMGK